MTGWKTRTLALAALLPAGACGDDITDPGETFAFSFDSSLEGWLADATDTDDPPVTWSIEHTTDTGNDDEGAAELMLDNLNDAGKIWLERRFDGLEPGASYDVTVSYAFATQDFGAFGLWRIIAGVTREDPETVDVLEFQDETGNGSQADIGYVWLDKDYTFTAQTDAAGELWVSVGVWGTFETPRTYYIDDLAVGLRRR